MMLFVLVTGGSIFILCCKGYAGDPYSVETPGVCGTYFFHEKKQKLYKQYGEPTRISSQILMDSGRVDSLGYPLRVVVGQQQVFWAYNFETGQYYQILATLKKVGTHCYVYVENGWVISATAINNAASEFDTTIYPTDTGIFGTEPDVDGDHRVTILLMDIQDGYPGSEGWTAGYFDPTNEYYDAHSNLREMVYMDIYPGDPVTNPTMFYGNLAHEFQHMIHYSRDPDEHSWIDEGCATLAEFLCGYGHNSNVRYFLAAPDNSLTSWAGALSDYGQVYLFLFYLWENYGGSPFVTHLTQNPDNGTAGITSSLAAKGYFSDFDTVFAEWTLANYLDDPSIGSGKYGYNGLDITAISPGGISLSDTWPSYPVTSVGNVKYHAADYIQFANGERVTFVFDGNNYDEFRLFLVEMTSTTQVTEMTLDLSNDGSTGAFAGYSSLVMVPVRIASSGGGGYSYEAYDEGLNGSSSPYSYYLPYFTQTSGYWTGVALSNSNAASAATVSVTVYSTDGIVSEKQEKNIDPRGQVCYVITTQSIEDGWMQVDSDQPLTGLCFVGSGSDAMADIPMVASVATTLHVPHVAQTEDFDTVFYICNPNADSTTVTLTYVQKDGTADTPHAYTIPARGMKTIELLSLLNGGEGNGGKVEITADPAGVAAFALYSTKIKEGGSWAGISAIEVGDGVRSTTIVP